MRKRRLILFAIVVVLLIGALVLWNRSRPKIPFEDSDLRIELVAVPAQSNGYHLLLKAGEAMDLSKQDSAVLGKLSRGSNWNAADVTELLDANKEAIQLVRAAAAQPFFQIDGVFENFSVTNDYLARLRSLANLLALDAQAQFRAGREREAFTNALTILELGIHIQRSPAPILIYLVAVVIEQRGLESLRQFAEQTRLPPAELLEFARRLEHLPASGGNLANALRGEYQFQSRRIEEMASGASNGSMPGITPPRMLFDPTKTKAITADYCRKAITASALTYSEGAPKLPRTETNQWSFRLLLSGNPIGTILSGLTARTWSSHQSRKSQLSTMREATRTLLALRAYQLRNGRLPVSLSELVPEYLPVLPLDDFDGKPLRYSAERKLLYSVGPDLVDSNGTASTNRLETGDLVFPFDMK